MTDIELNISAPNGAAEAIAAARAFVGDRGGWREGREVPDAAPRTLSVQPGSVVHQVGDTLTVVPDKHFQVAQIAADLVSKNLDNIATTDDHLRAVDYLTALARRIVEGAYADCA